MMRRLIGMLVAGTVIAMFVVLLVGENIHKEDRRRVVARVQVNIFEQALSQYKLNCGSFPTTEQGLEALWSRPASVDHWDGPYLRNEVQLDPWGHPYVYKFPGGHGNQPDIVSHGADGRDIVSWKN